MKLFSVRSPQKKSNTMPNNKGFTYLMAMMIIMIMGIMLGMVGQSWKTIMQREREEELIFRGTQIMDAIGRWNKPKPGEHVATPLRDLKDLVQDPRTLTIKRYLRRLYTDPMTGKEWNVINDPNLGITGVASTSQSKPLKTGNFPVGLESFEKKERYSDWLFDAGQKKPGIPNTPSTGIKGLPPGMSH
jgi:type II secretory pathway pseudopilin PulG